eukprot:4719034-Alexandrium_andersonii.AAC.1
MDQKSDVVDPHEHREAEAPQVVERGLHDCPHGGEIVNAFCRGEVTHRDRGGAQRWLLLE